MRMNVRSTIMGLLLSVPLGVASAQENPCFAELETMTTEDGIEFVRTPDACFENLPDWPYAPEYVTIDGLRQAYVDVGPRDADETILLLHGQPSWSYLYRKMIPVLVEAGHRVIAMDHLGMGRSDKPTDLDYYRYLDHTYRLEAFIQALELEEISLFAQDWGSLIGLYVVGLNPDPFRRVILGNGALPVFTETPFGLPKNPLITRQMFHRSITSIPAKQTAFFDAEGDRIDGQISGDFFGIWIDYARNFKRFKASDIIEAVTFFELNEGEKAAYDAPFPARIAMGGPRSFPGLANTLVGVTDKAWLGLSTFEKPFLTIWGGNDPGNLGRPDVQHAMIAQVPGAEGWDHVRLPEASHFLQDDQGEEIARRINAFIKASPDAAPQ